MKLSLTWIFDHLSGDRNNVDTADLVDQLRKTTAEIDGVRHISWQWDQFFIGEVHSVSTQKTTIYLPEEDIVCQLLLRPELAIGNQVLLKREKNNFRWATLEDLGASREGFLPSLYSPATQIADGSWRKELNNHDVILEIDNKSLTNRPDLWGHRGFAREIAAIYRRKLVPEEQLCVSFPVRHFEWESPEIIIEKNSACSRFAGLNLTIERFCSSVLWMAHRLACIDARPINALVDATNYTMYDLGHPMHAYDKNRLAEGPITARQARDGETLTLLDDEKITLTSADCVITDTYHPVALAGIMGGASSAISEATKNVFIEAAHFAPATIRQTAARYKNRTESSARFEKGMDPNLTATVIQRFGAILDELNVPYTTKGIIDSVGALAPTVHLEVLHRFIIDRLGASVTPTHLVELLERLGFGVQMIETSDGLAYRITVPSWRSFRDIRIPEDIVEEVGRFYGFELIPLALPTRMMQPFSLGKMEQRRLIRRFLAYTCGMHEVATYPLFDETWIAKLKLSTEQSVSLLNPLSSQASHLVTTLIPALLKCVEINAHDFDELRFFELASNWQLTEDKKGIDEKRVCAGIFASRASSLDFYQVKEYLQKLFDALDLMVSWRKGPQPMWADESEYAVLFSGETYFGTVGRIKKTWEVAADVKCAYAFELLETPLITAPRRDHYFEQLGKFQAVNLDISMLAPYSVTVAELEEAIALTDIRIRDITLIDLFEKPEWGNKRSVTLRYVVRDDEKTLTKEDIENIQNEVAIAVKKHHAEVRT
ncbi:MAG: phenylalanine--tRNA ligase subunit beta [Candidatus Babeliaceae bacterium]|nr:phenylalanine--tRNA ligase subunit beta [Candidatus Babeliaceae bacterium]